ncbi:MAG: transcriptional regulator [Candidatus Cloacimonadota bacterium]|nr:MAG: transcriptional regulator [Candidatus Cloacimonadota bacterium]
MKVPLLDLSLQNNPVLDEIKEEIEKVYSSHHYILGSQVREFEEDMEKFLGIKHAIGCASGSDALILALLACGIKEGDEVITVSFTFFASVSAIHRIGAKPVLVDIDYDTFNIDPDEIRKAITCKTKAIMPVHLFGQPADTDKIKKIAEEYNLKIIEDTAQGIGGKFSGKFAGTIGDVGTLSFFPSKNLGAMGDGGMCLTDDDETALKLRKLRVHGEYKKYHHNQVGLNSRLDTIQAAVLKIKLKYLNKWTAMRKENGAFYNEHLAGIPEVKIPFIHEKAETVYNQYTLKVERRDELMRYLQENGIGCAIYYPLPLHLQECFADLGYRKGDFPNSEKVADSVLSIPIYSELTEDQKYYVVEKIKSFYK